MNKKNYSAFTLVELVVVIVILAILTTIGFIAYSEHTASARDSARLSDMESIVNGLNIEKTDTSKNPLPDSPVSITAS